MALTHLYMPTLSTGDCVLTLDHKPWAAGPVAAAECQSIPYRLRRHILYPQGRKEEGTVVPPILLPGTFVKEEGVRFRPDASRRRIRQGRGRRHYGFTSRRRRLGGNKESEYTSLQDWNAQSLPVACDRWPELPRVKAVHATTHKTHIKVSTLYTRHNRTRNTTHTKGPSLSTL